MGIFSIFSKQQPIAVAITKEIQADSFSLMTFSRPEIPTIVEKRNQEWISFGEDNDYPQKLKEFLATCAMHNSIVNGKTQMQAGAGLLLNGAVDQAASEAAYNALSPE